MQQIPEVIIQAIASIFIGVLVIGFIIAITQLLKKRKQLQEIEIANIKTAFEKDLLQTRLEIQEEVLKNISMEIHDNIGQVMLLANVNTSILQSMPMPAGAPELIVETKGLLSKAIDDISQLSRSLHSDRITDMGAFSAIQYELRLLEQKGLYKVTVNNQTTTAEKSISKETQLVVFRMFQEIIKNIIKHAQADSIEFTITDKKGGIEMVITDNGIGFDQSGATEVPNGVGMRSLQSRVNLIKGDLTVQSVLQKGTCISIFIPVTHD